MFRRSGESEPLVLHVQLNEKYAFDQFSFGSQYVSRPDLTGIPGTEYIDGDRVGMNLVLRPWRDGDWFVPLGMREKKKLSDFFIDEKIPLFEKRRIPILECDGNILWICGKRIDDRYKISSKTVKFIKLEYRQFGLNEKNHYDQQ